MLLLALVPFNTELMQCFPWKNPVHDGMPTSLAMAAAAGLSLSHGCAIFLLVLWIYSKGGPLSTVDLLNVLVLTAPPLCFLGVRRVWLLLFTTSHRTHEPGAINAVRSKATSTSKPENSPGLWTPPAHMLQGNHSVAEPVRQPDAAAVRLRAVQRQQAALVAMRAAHARDVGATPQMLPPAAVRYLDGRCKASASSGGDGVLVHSRVERASAANSSKREMVGSHSGERQQAGVRPVMAVVVRKLGSPSDERDPRAVGVQSSEDPPAGQSGPSESCVRDSAGLEAVLSDGLANRTGGIIEGKTDSDETPSSSGQDRMQPGTHLSTRVQRAHTANIAQRAERARAVQVRAERARSSNRATRERLESEHAEAASAVATVEQWRPSGVDTSPQRSLEPQLSHTPTTPNPRPNSHDSADDANDTPCSASDHDQATRLDRARHSNRVRRAREAFAGDAAIDPKI